MPSTTALRFHLHPVAELVPVPTTNPVPGAKKMPHIWGISPGNGEESVSLSGNNGENYRISAANMVNLVIQRAKNRKMSYFMILMARSTFFGL